MNHPLTVDVSKVTEPIAAGSCVNSGSLTSAACLPGPWPRVRLRASQPDPLGVWRSGTSTCGAPTAGIITRVVFQTSNSA